MSSSDLTTLAPFALPMGLFVGSIYDPDSNYGFDDSICVAFGVQPAIAFCFDVSPAIEYDFTAQPAVDFSFETGCP